MKNTVLQRVIEIMKLKSNSEREFASIIGANQKTINQQLKQERSLSLDTVLNIISSFEDVSTEWLFRGNGDMVLTEPSSKELKSASNNNNAFAELKEEIIALKAENKVLRELAGLGERKDSNRSA